VSRIKTNPLSAACRKSGLKTFASYNCQLVRPKHEGFQSPVDSEGNSISVPVVVKSFKNLFCKTPRRHRVGGIKPRSVGQRTHSGGADPPPSQVCAVFDKTQDRSSHSPAHFLTGYQISSGLTT